MQAAMDKPWKSLADLLQHAGASALESEIAIARVALRRLFDYLPPANLPARDLASLRPGQRLRVPFGHRQVTGYLVEKSLSVDNIFVFAPRSFKNEMLHLAVDSPFF